jgi:hypothetical protein
MVCLAAAIIVIVLSVAVSLAYQSHGVSTHQILRPVVHDGAHAAVSTPPLAIFERQATASDSLPSAIAQEIPALFPQTTTEPGMARRALVTSYGAAVYLVPSSEGACLLILSGTDNLCASDSQIASGDATSGDACSPGLPSGDVEVAGIVPNFATSPDLVLSNGSDLPLAIQGNAYVVDLPRSGPLPVEVRWSREGATVVRSSNLPSDASTIHCVTPEMLHRPAVCLRRPDSVIAAQAFACAGPFLRPAQAAWALAIARIAVPKFAYVIFGRLPDIVVS